MGKNPLSGLLTILIIGISATLPALLYLILSSIQDISSHWGSQPSLSVYLKKTANNEQTQSLINTLQLHPNVTAVNYISPQQGLAELKQNEPFQGVLKLLKSNPLPPVVVIRLAKLKHGSQSIEPLLNLLKQSSLVDQTHFDTTWIERVQYGLSATKRITLVLSLILSVGLTLVVSNTIRLNTQTHHHNIEVLKFIGASKNYIRRPYLYQGLLYGCLGGLLSWGFVSVTMLWIGEPARKLFQSYQIHFSTTSMLSTIGILLISISSILSIVGAWLAVDQQLDSRPT